MFKVTNAYPHNPHPAQRLARLAFLLVLLAGLAWGLSTLPNAVQSAPNIPLRVAQLSDIPIAAHRRAAQHLEEMRFSEMTPGWERAILGQEVRFLYRPDDLQNPAYYEIPVILPESNNMPAGFMILAANENDFPIAHWDFSGEPPTQQLDKISNYTAAVYYKLDTLSYVAEDTKGSIVATLGQLPPKIEGMNMDWLDQEQKLGAATWVPDENLGDDGGAGTISGTLVVSGTVTPPTELNITEWESWDALKTGYTDSYGVFLEEQRREASEVWRGEQADLEYGIVLAKEEVYDLAMLWSDPTVTLDGPGLAYITTQTVTQGLPVPELFRITVADTVPLGSTPFTATVNYSNDVEETVRFQIVEQRFVYLPLVLLNHNGSTGVTSLAAAVNAPKFKGEVINAPTAVNGWSSWHYFWAGSHGDQRLYNQMAANDPQNPSSCWSGCGATGWAMLFGWADNQAASGNAYWAPRWGLYRENGGYGTNVVAPQYWDTGVKNMIWEIRQRIGTFCAFGSGATAPWDMSGASGYLAGRTGTRLYTHYNSVGIQEGGLRERARDSIIYRDTPAIIGTGWLNHYPLAYGYAWRSRRRCFIGCWTEYDRWFYVNQGWGGSDNGWVSAGTWFAGEIRP
ncbi:MAG: hypothetical protein ACK2UQ_07325 [Anaerolineae bacterium]